MFAWLVEVVEDSAELWDEGRLVWSVRYVLEGADRPRQHHSSLSQRDSSHRTTKEEDTRKKITARFEIQKDDIQAVLPISKVCVTFSVCLNNHVGKYFQILGGLWNSTVSVSS